MTPATIRVLLLFALALVGVDRQTVAGPDELTKAIQKKDKELVARLLASGANVNARDSLDDTPLLVAIDFYNREIFELLLASGADVQARANGLRRSMLHVAVDTVLFAVDGSNKSEAAELLLARGADVNVEDRYAVTPLHLAASNGDTKMVALLLAKGANVNAKSNMISVGHDVGDTPLHFAVRREGPYLRFLAAFSKLTPQERQKDESTGWHAYLATAALLLAHGADVNATNNKGKTPLRYATSKEMKALLREHGAR